ncbi:MAG: hypothetical protein WCW14_03645, partial [Candidatus Paceibacterota bacterium]
IPVSFISKQGGNRMFLIFKILYDDWVANPQGSGITKAETISELKKYDAECSERDVKDTIVNLRKLKIERMGLKDYVEIRYFDKQHRYRLNIKRALL